MKCAVSLPPTLSSIFPSVWLRLGYHPRLLPAVMDTAIARLRASASKYAAENAELRAELLAARAQLARSQRQPEPEPEPEPERQPQTRQRQQLRPAPPDAAARRRMSARPSPISVVLDPGPPPSVAAVVLQPWALGLIVAVPVSACFVGVRYCQR